MRPSRRRDAEGKVLRMTAMIQIRNVPDALHRRLKSRAALAGMSPSKYLLSEIRQGGATDAR
jgi:hypothetical protein